MSQRTWFPFASRLDRLPLLGLLAAALSVALWVTPVGASPAPAAPVGSEPIDYQRVAPSLQGLPLPLHLPARLYYSTATFRGSNKLFAIGGVWPNPDTAQPGYNVSVINDPKCLGALSCTIAYASAEAITSDYQSIEDTYAWFRAPGALNRYRRVSPDPIGWVTLSNGQSVFFVPWVVGASMGFAQVIWDEGGYRYTIGLKGGDRQWLIQMAETAFSAR